VLIYLDLSIRLSGSFHFGSCGEILLEAVDGGFDGRIEGGLVGEAAGAVFSGFEGFEGFELGECAEQGDDRGAVVPELGFQEPGSAEEDFGVVGSSLWRFRGRSFCRSAAG
jgi:hypothetical protein